MATASPIVLVVNGSGRSGSSSTTPEKQQQQNYHGKLSPTNTNSSTLKSERDLAMPGTSRAASSISSSGHSEPETAAQSKATTADRELSPDRMNGARPAYQQHQRHISSMSQPTPTPSRRGGGGQQPDTVSLCSTTSAMSSCPDRHGFYGGAQFSAKPEKEKLTKAQVLAREKKWLHMIQNWKEYMTKNYKKVRERCRKGIPSSVRPKAWFYLTGAYLLQQKYPDVYREMLKQDGDPHVIEEIRKDQHRQFPFHEMFLDEEKPG